MGAPAAPWRGRSWGVGSPRLFAAAVIGAALGLAACARTEPCELQPIDQAEAAGTGLEATCPRIQVDGRVYEAYSVFPLTEEGVKSLVPYGGVEAATLAIGGNYRQPGSRTVWSFAGADPEGVLWGTDDYTAGDGYILWIALDYPGHPYLCDVVDREVMAARGLEVPPLLESCS